MQSEGVSSIALALRETNVIEDLGLWDNRIGSSGAEALSRLLSHCTSLRTLRLKFNPLKQQGEAMLAQGMQRNSTLRELDLRMCELGSAFSLAESLKQNTTLTELLLDQNEMPARAVAEVLKSLKTNKGIKRLDLSGNFISDKYALDMSMSLRYNTSLEVLGLATSKDTFTNRGAALMVDAANDSSCMKMLNLSQNNQIDGKVLPQPLSGLSVQLSATSRSPASRKKRLFWW